MFGLFSKDTFQHTTLGELTRKGSSWIGTTTVATHGRVPLQVAGGRKAPDAASLQLAGEMPALSKAAKAALEQALFSHYRDMFDAHGGQLDGVPVIDDPRAVWAQTQVALVDVDASRRAFPVEIRITVGWDEDHTLGARLNGTTLVELNGSV